MLWENTPATRELEAESEMEQPVRWNPAPHPEHPQGDLKGDRRQDTCERTDQARQPAHIHLLHAWSYRGLNENGPFPSVVSTAVMKHHDQKQLGKERVNLVCGSYHSPSLKEIRDL